MLYVAYFLALVAAAAVIAGVSHWIWRREIASMPVPPRWLEAQRFVWVDCYKMRWEDLPRVITVRGKTFSYGGQPCAGKSDFRSITVAVEADDTMPSNTALHHELYHQALEKRGVVDRGHSLREWQPGGLVEATRAAMKARGM